MSLGGQLFPQGVPRCAAFVGAGGKSSAILQIANELTAQGERVKITTTTHISRRIPANPRIEVCGKPAEDGKLGMPDDIASLKSEDCFLLVEADGSKRLPLKMTADYEPVIPEFADAVVAVAGMSCIGRPFDEVCHRYELACEFLGAGAADRVEPEHVAALLWECYIRRADRELVVLLNQAGSPNKLAAAAKIAELLAGVRCVTADLLLL